MAYIKLFNMNITRPPKGSKKRHLSPNAIRGYQLESTDKGNHRFDQPPPATDRSGDSALFRVLDQSQSSGSSSDEGEVIDCGPSCDSTRRVERNFTPLNFSITDVEAGCDLLNVFTEESMDIMRLSRRKNWRGEGPVVFLVVGLSREHCFFPSHLRIPIEGYR